MQSRPDQLGNTLLVREKLIVPDADDSEALRAKVGIPALIARIVSMLATIKLDNQTGCEADEIHNVEVDGLLPFEFEAGEAMRPEQLP